jgi:hypothetical protein
MVGSNVYNENTLHLAGRASQNLYVFYKSGNRDALKIDLHDVQQIEGYDIIKELEAYNAKAHEKAHESKVILEVII